MTDPTQRHLRAVEGTSEPATDGVDDRDLAEVEERVEERADAVLEAVDAALDVDVEATASGDEAGETDPLLARAARLAELPLQERPAAIESLDAALVQELNALEDL